MQIEFEATYTNINKDHIRDILKKVGAELLRSEFMQRRVVLQFPKGHEIAGGWIRVRDEGNKITQSIKIVNGNNIEDQKELCIEVSDFDEAVSFLETLGCNKKAYQESKRELWILNGVEITIDEWPFLEPFVEVEGPSEDAVKQVSEVLGFDYKTAMFCAVDVLYSQKYNISTDRINNHTPEILFEGQNPFVKRA